MVRLSALLVLACAFALAFAAGMLSYSGWGGTSGSDRAAFAAGSSSDTTRRNLLDNASFENSLAGWESVPVVGNNLSGLDATVSHSGSSSYAQTSNITCNPVVGDWWSLQASSLTPVEAGHTYALGAWYRKSEGLNFGVTFSFATAVAPMSFPAIELGKRSTGATEIRGENGASTDAVSEVAQQQSSGKWVRAEFLIVVPDGMNALRVFIGTLAQCNGLSTFHVDDVSLRLVK